jgi:surface antigen
MRFRNLFVKLFWDRLLVAPLCLASVLGTLAHADAATRHPHHHHRLVAASRHETRYARRGSSHHGHARLQCVPYARRVSGIELTGNADRWWREADGRYARGHAPELDAVLSFKRSGRMPLGHVAVVTKTVNPRQVLVTQANWPSFGWRGGDISKAASVIDVSPDNDWTEVRVQVGHSAVYGAVYRTDGFIYGHAPSETRAGGRPCSLPPRRTTAGPRSRPARPTAKSGRAPRRRHGLACRPPRTIAAVRRKRGCRADSPEVLRCPAIPSIAGRSCLG